LTQNELLLIVNKTISCVDSFRCLLSPPLISLSSTLDDLSLEALPSVIYQLLLLSSKGGQDAIFRGISAYFTKLDDSLRPQHDDGTCADLVLMNYRSLR